MHILYKPSCLDFKFLERAGETSMINLTKCPIPCNVQVSCLNLLKVILWNSNSRYPSEMLATVPQWLFIRSYLKGSCSSFWLMVPYPEVDKLGCNWFNIGLQDSPELLISQLLQLEVGKQKMLSPPYEDAMFLCPALANELSVNITIQND